jgi:hypothetical protein
VDIAGSNDEVYVGPDTPVDTVTELWYDTDETGPLTPPSAGMLKAKVGGTWVPVAAAGSGGGSDEVSISATDPIGTAPTTELWYDTDDVMSGAPMNRQLCTSTTRPVGYDGLEIYESDTKRAYIHNGISWVLSFAPPSERVYGKTFAPGSTLSAGTGGGYTDWMTLDAAVPVPVWATRFRFMVNVTYLLFATAGGNIYGVRLALGTAFSTGFNFDDASKSHFDLAFNEILSTVNPGTNQSLRVQANRVGGTGTWSAGTFGTTVGITIDWLP